MRVESSKGENVTRLLYEIKSWQVYVQIASLFFLASEYCMHLGWALRRIGSWSKWSRGSISLPWMWWQLVVVARILTPTCDIIQLHPVHACPFCEHACRTYWPAAWSMMIKHVVGFVVSIFCIYTYHTYTHKSEKKHRWTLYCKWSEQIHM